MFARQTAIVLLGLTSVVATAQDFMWIEGEDAKQTTATRHPWYTSVDRDQLSGGDMLSHFDDSRPASAEYEFKVVQAGKQQLWIRSNHVATRLAYSLNNGVPQEISTDQNFQDPINIAADKKPDLRFLSWIHVGEIELTRGVNTIEFTFNSANSHHGLLDCLVIAKGNFSPQGKYKPGERPTVEAEEGWFAFQPGPSSPTGNHALDLSWLNESQAGSKGRIVARAGRFFHESDGQEVRFWGVNGPPEQLSGPALEACAETLARYGVNLVRVHSAIFDRQGNPDIKKIRQHLEVVRVMKSHGIYTHFSFYFPLWFTPSKDLEWLPGYDGTQHPFAALMFNEAFQAKYRTWMHALLTVSDSTTGLTLATDPAVFGIELQNEDSFFFWTFNPEAIPRQQLEILEANFASWLTERYGTLDSALRAWGNMRLPRDNAAAQRIAFRPLFNIANDRLQRDVDTATFLLSQQTDFYDSMRDYARELGFKGLITASNWHTASEERLGPLEKLSYTSCDFIDRHGYFECNHKGDNAAWSIRPNHTFSHRSALRFDGPAPGRPKDFNHPVMDPQYNDKPSMISETTFTRPNRHRGEAPLYYASYGALQDSDAIIHFAFDGDQWQVKPRFWMQQWTLASPAMLGQFPASALIYRQSLIDPAPIVAEIDLNVKDLQQLNGTPLPQGASFDELRAKDIPKGMEVQPGQSLDPLLHFVGRVQVNFTDDPTKVQLSEHINHINRERQLVRSAHDQLALDYGRGILRINSPKAQGASGNLAALPTIKCQNLEITSPLDAAHIVLVPLDNQPIESSSRMLLQVMTEERPHRFESEETMDGIYRIVSIGEDPWVVRDIKGQVRILRKDSASLRVTALDHSGNISQQLGPANSITLLRDVIYYLIEK